MKNLDRVDARRSRHDESRFATRQNKLDLAFTQRGINGDNHGAEINAGEVEDRQFTTVRDHHRDTVTLLNATPAKLRGQGTGLPVKISVGNLTARNSVNQEDPLPAARYHIHDCFADGHLIAGLDRALLGHCIAKVRGWADFMRFEMEAHRSIWPR